MLAELGSGPFGSVYRAVLPGGTDPVVVRAFSHVDTPEQGMALLQAFTRLCEVPLSHRSIAQPLSCGIEGNLPYIVYAYLEGEVLRDRLTHDRPHRLAELMRSVIQIAGAIDFAAAVGLHHGALDHYDVISGGETTGVTAFGVVDALIAAGLNASEPAPYASPQRRAGAAPTLSDDVYSLAAVTYELIYGRPFAPGQQAADVDGVDAVRLASVFGAALAESPEERPRTALEFASSLQAATEPPFADVQIRPRPAAVGAAPHRAVGRVLTEPPARVRGTRGPALAVAAAMLVIGVVIGFAGGLTAGRVVLPLQSGDARSTAADARPTVSATDAVLEPAGTAGEPVAEPTGERPVPADATPSPSLGVAPSGPAPSSASSNASAVSGPGTLQVESRPDGAAVILNGRSVGVTPLTLSSVAAGRHTVQIALAGHRSWRTSVSVEPNGHARIGASLER